MFPFCFLIWIMDPFIIFLFCPVTANDPPRIISSYFKNKLFHTGMQNIRIGSTFVRFESSTIFNFKLLQTFQNLKIFFYILNKTFFSKTKNLLLHTVKKSVILLCTMQMYLTICIKEEFVCHIYFQF